MWTPGATETGAARPLLPVWRSPDRQLLPASAATPGPASGNHPGPIRGAGLHPVMDKRPGERPGEPSGVSTVISEGLLESDRAGGPRFIHFTRSPKAEKSRVGGIKLQVHTARQVSGWRGVCCVALGESSAVICSAAAGLPGGGACFPSSAQLGIAGLAGARSPKTLPCSWSHPIS